MNGTGAVGTANSTGAVSIGNCAVTCAEAPSDSVVLVVAAACGEGSVSSVDACKAASLSAMGSAGSGSASG